MRRHVPYSGDDRGPGWLALLFLAIGVPLLCITSLMVPTGEVPDEPLHAVRAESLLEGQIIGHRAPYVIPGFPNEQISGVDADFGIARGVISLDWNLPIASRTMTREHYRVMFEQVWDGHRKFIDAPSLAGYFPIFYVPAAIGIGIQKARGGLPHAAVLAGRLVQALAYLLVGALAIGLARRGAGLNFAVLMLPMSLWLAGSVSQDGLLIATSCLSAALFTRDEPWARVGRLVLLALVLLAKPPYLPLALLALPPSWPNWRRLPGALAPAIAVTVPALAWSALISRVVLTGVVKGPPAPAGPLWPGDPARIFAETDAGAQLQVLLHHPSLFWRLPWAALLQDGGLWFTQMLGQLGLLDLPVPTALLVLCAIALAAGLLAAVRPMPGPARPLVWAAAPLCILAILIAEYLSWTPVGATAIEGMQGRYLIPLLPFLALGMPSWPAPERLAVLGRACLVPVVAAGLATAAALPILVTLTYYLRPAG